MRRSYRSLAKFVLLPALGALVAEGVLQVAVLASPSIRNALAAPWARQPPPPQAVPDAVLGHRPNPDRPGHDRRGFRNSRTLKHASIVTLGDSQTYGTNVKSREAWPKQLQRRMPRRQVYSMSFGGYCPLHYRALLPEALAMHPDLIIVAVYSGNDLYEAYSFAYRAHEQAGQNENEGAEPTRHDLAEREMADELAKRIAKDMDVVLRVAPRRPPQRPGVLRFVLSSHCRLYGLIRALRHRTFCSTPLESRDWQHVLALAAEHPERLVPIDVPPFRTVLTPSYRLNAMRLDHPRIQAGLRLCLGALREMQMQCVAAGVDFAVLKIPTKELVFAEVVADRPGSMSAACSDLVVNECAFWHRLTMFLSDNGIEQIDALPLLRKCLADGRQPYDNSWDGHPNPVGHAAIASAVERRIKHSSDL